MRAASPPRQMERENEMIVISHRLKFESRDEWLETRDKTRRHQTSDIRHQTSDFYPPIFGHRPIYICGEAATSTLGTSQRTPLFSLLPLEGGAPKGRRLALEAVFSHTGMPTPPRFARLPLPEEGARMILNRSLPHTYLRRNRHHTPEPRTLYLCYNNMNMFESKGGALWDPKTC